MHPSSPPDPNDFSSFEEYEEALALYEAFIQKSQEVSKALENINSDEEFENVMESMGFQKFELPICEGDWCQKNDSCLASVLDDFQMLANEHFFWEMMPEEEKILKIGKSVNDICELIPPHWKAKNSKQRQILDFCFDMMEEIVTNNKCKLSYEEIMDKNSVQEFGRNLYLFCHRILFPQKSKEKEERFLQKFLKKNEILQAQSSEKFLKRLEKIIETPG